ncbi:DciA family protein [Synechococcus sp. PCC 6312]|uniref:DciA family protein n=1 Tax=Synechococcus sp. (strain ATCC 27167 / PCC 6312) TaxID=195253 RepID=UPI00029F1C71|nr:DUF721 domain-containing protein [Synechococcus sp. PCC 6312]AFY59891.1 putative RNA-binding protein containing Zn ribbon [Synechococcus sp. PCC 6312]
MPLAPIDRVLVRLQEDPAWSEPQRFWFILQAWNEIVGEVVARQAQPVTILPPHRLQVAVANSVWAQTLSFERLRILAKLNQRLPVPLQDIHFSSRDWPIKRPLQKLTNRSELPLVRSQPRLHKPAPPSAQAAFSQWSTAVQKFTARLPLCPQCQCPTPRPELDQWKMCGLCHARQTA